MTKATGTGHEKPRSGRGLGVGASVVIFFFVDSRLPAVFTTKSRRNGAGLGG